MVKKISILLLLLITFGTSAFADYEKVYDEAQLFSEDERAELNEKAFALTEKTEMDIVIVTIDDSEGKPSSEYALDFYDEHGFGYNGTLDGVLYLLNMDEREVYIFTRDKGTNYIDANRVEELLDLVYPSLGEEKYSESAHIFLDEVEKMMDAGPPTVSVPGHSNSNASTDSGYVDTNNGYATSGTTWLQKLGIYLLISMAIGGITIGIMAMGNKGRSTVNARTYLQDNSFALTRKTDQHYNTIVTQQKIPKANNNSSGGSFSGRAGGGGIGGGGRKF
ncbi:TPM domain-containing protein [Robertmurraya massiliosenegalensis]|uniref:TPM domain-containing protein n=1 Tax=Robertmurraya TaxID=2837507 RepID=UPI0039A4F06B